MNSKSNNRLRVRKKHGLRAFTKEEGKDLAAAIPELEAVAFSVLGAYLLFRAIADATYHLSKFKFYEKVILPDAIFVGPSILPDDFANFITTGVEFILAIYLLLGASGGGLTCKVAPE